MKQTKQTKKALNAWQDRGFGDGSAGRIARTPLSAGDEAMERYLLGYRKGAEKREAEK